MKIQCFRALCAQADRQTEWLLGLLDGAKNSTLNLAASLSPRPCSECSPSLFSLALMFGHDKDTILNWTLFKAKTNNVITEMAHTDRKRFLESEDITVSSWRYKINMGAIRSKVRCQLNNKKTECYRWYMLDMCGQLEEHWKYSKYLTQMTKKCVIFNPG